MKNIMNGRENRDRRWMLRVEKMGKMMIVCFFDTFLLYELDSRKYIFNFILSK